MPSERASGYMLVWKKVHVRSQTTYRQFMYVFGIIPYFWIKKQACFQDGCVNFLSLDYLCMIGSGVIESTCKHLVVQRCRRASMRWTDEELQSILELRCMYKNRTWRKYWYPDPVDDPSPEIIDVSSLNTRAA